jgi:hypothetical protein
MSNKEIPAWNQPSGNFLLMDIHPDSANARFEDVFVQLF